MKYPDENSVSGNSLTPSKGNSLVLGNIGLKSAELVVGTDSIVTLADSLRRTAYRLACLRGSRLETQHNQSLNDTMTCTDFCSREPKIIGGNNKNYSFVQLHVS